MCFVLLRYVQWCSAYEISINCLYCSLFGVALDWFVTLESPRLSPQSSLRSTWIVGGGRYGGDPELSISKAPQQTMVMMV